MAVLTTKERKKFTLEVHWLSSYFSQGGVTMWEVVRPCGRSVDMYIDSVAKLSIATGHAMQIYNCLNCPRQL